MYNLKYIIGRKFLKLTYITTPQIKIWHLSVPPKSLGSLHLGSFFSLNRHNPPLFANDN